MNMQIQAHDLLWGMTSQMLPDDVPDWVNDVITARQPVVVRRAVTDPKRVAVGIRGQYRYQRFATEMPKNAIIRQIKPENLRLTDLALFPHLQQILQPLHDTMQKFNLPWGYTGSVGFELATGMRTVTENSDIDLLIRTEQPLVKSEASYMLKILETLGLKTDVQLQTPLGGIALKEWAGTTGKVLLKRHDKAVLVENPWNERRE
ncbi:malonate decarboxylase holo-ACP synthase [Acinetobacter qingfengensis]|uniref:Phosphoribosyl-dephospho-CoA transferase n=1 Tax=Acinetobacter qingfengensis TaxID=1262585 RepID=A0A1E7R690_9GAMM|nr:malonate decarboxylase holo-ACP synthase [Acinetobacter qingfengensis]KAA8734863.1 malonate decarboxylase holo-ACP synthase [Acinetobacter qingfengensis]OEY94783.1 phosphoribosyl-dephospho-CoA transferase [Acinetobacter qingfengensis]